MAGRFIWFLGWIRCRQVHPIAHINDGGFDPLRQTVWPYSEWLSNIWLQFLLSDLSRDERVVLVGSSGI